MTTKEAMETLKLMQAQVEWDYPIDYAAAIDVAVKALEEVSGWRRMTVPDTNVGDTISRQEAIR